jgi:hypothetical protein
MAELIKPNYAELLSILELKRTGMESSQIHEEAHKRENSLLGDVSSISSMLWQCKNTNRVVAEKRNGVIINKITQTGLRNLAEYNKAFKMEKVQTPALENGTVAMMGDSLTVKVSKIKALKAEIKKLAQELVDDLLAMD